MERRIAVEKLTRDAFAPFGDVIEAGVGPAKTVNFGMGEKWDDLATLHLATQGARVNAGLLQSRPGPFRFTQMERHLLGTQLFIPLGGKRCLVPVAPPSHLDDAQAHPIVEEVRIFLMEGHQSVNLAIGTWHYPFFPLDGPMDFVLLMRGGQIPPDYHLKSLAADGSVSVVADIPTLPKHGGWQPNTASAGGLTA